jgi:hypothetical protein
MSWLSISCLTLSWDVPFPVKMRRGIYVAVSELDSIQSTKFFTFPFSFGWDLLGGFLGVWGFLGVLDFLAVFLTVFIGKIFPGVVLLKILP